MSFNTLDFSPISVIDEPEVKSDKNVEGPSNAGEEKKKG